MPRIAELVESGELLPVTVDGWRTQGYLWHQAQIPRQLNCRALCSPFDFGGQRGPRLFDFDHRIAFYQPKTERRYGYYVLPFLSASDR